MPAGRAAAHVWDSEYGTRQAAGSHKASSNSTLLLLHFRHTVHIQLQLTAKLPETRKKDRNKGRHSHWWERWVTKNTEKKRKKSRKCKGEQVVRQGQTADFDFQPCLPHLDLNWVNTAPSTNMFSLMYTLIGWSALLRSLPRPLPLLLCQEPLSPSFASLAAVCHLFGGSPNASASLITSRLNFPN